jgi:hypothetical protein
VVAPRVRPDAHAVAIGLDRVGVVASTLCAIHCAAGAVLIGASSLLGIVRDERTEAALVGVALLVAAGSLVPGYCRHRSRAPLGLLAVGIALLGAAHLVEWPQPLVEAALSIGGATALVGAHFINLRVSKRAARCSRC